MLANLLTEDMIQIEEKESDWKSAIRLASIPLLRKKIIKERYIEAMINNVNNLGPYIVLAPKIAVPHARPEDGVNEIGLSLLKLNQPVSFKKGDSDKDVNIIIVIAAIDNSMHLKALSELSHILEDEDNIEKLIKIQSISNVVDFFNNK